MPDATVPSASRFAVLARAGLLPLLLALAVVLGLGSYAETNDDGTLAWLFAGVLARPAVTAVPLYLHGYGHLLAAGYAAAPGVPWLGLLLGALLAAATLLWFAVLERLLRPWLRPGALLLALGLFFGLAWLEHWLWFSHARVAVLLAAGGLLFAGQRAGRRGPWLLGLAALLAAWLVRPGLAGLGALAALPAVLALAGGGRRARPLLLGAAALLALAFGALRLSQPPAAARAQARDARLAMILDYGLLVPRPRTAADSLGTAAISAWLLGEVPLIDATLRGPAYQFEPADFWGRALPAKLRLRAEVLGRDYLPLALALLGSAALLLRQPRRGGRWRWLGQAAFAAALTLLAGVLKLPPRLALPLLDCWLLFNLAALLPPGAAGSEAAGSLVVPRAGRGALLGGLALAAGLYAAKTAHRWQVLRREQQHNLGALGRLRARHGSAVRVLGGGVDFLKSASPFRVYSPGPGPVLQLVGWPGYDASQPRLRQRLTGAAGQPEALRRLALRPAAEGAAPVVWLLAPETAAWLNRRWQRAGAGVWLRPAASAGSQGGEYQAEALPPAPLPPR